MQEQKLLNGTQNLSREGLAGLRTLKITDPKFNFEVDA